MKLSNNINFIKKAKIIHTIDNYDYSLVEYKNARTKVKIICDIHGVFEQTPDKHLRNQGCPKCKGTIKLVDEEFIKKSKEIHGNKYDYSKLEYKGITKKVTLICKKHGIFEQIAGTHIYDKCGCPKCASSTLSNTIEFIKKSKKIHKDKYDYSSVDYINCKSKVKIICKKHGFFEQTPFKHLHGNGCPKCSDNIKLNTEEFIKRAKKVHGETYDYSLVKYRTNRIKIKIICKTHGIFEQIPSNHVSKSQNCPLCKINSKGELEINKILTNLNLEFETQKRFNKCKNILTLPFDFYIPKYNLLIEFDGRQHFNLNTKYYTQNLHDNDIIKNIFCYENDYDLLRIKYDENIKEKIKEKLC